MNTRLTTPSHEEVTARALQLWQIAGNPVGRDVEFWLAAEAEVIHERAEITQAADKPAAIPPSTVTARTMRPVSQTSSSQQKHLPGHLCRPAC